MKITKYIKEALFEHSCVIVPGFGGFLSEEKSAQINPISNLFEAPSINLAFNASLTKDDGLLRSEISIGEGINLAQASEEIKKFVSEIEQQLQEEREVLIDGLGTFCKQEGKIVYKPESISNLNIEGFGLNDFKFDPIERNTEDMKHPRPVPPARRVAKRVPVKKEQETATTESVESKNQEEQPSNKKSIFLILPIVLLVIAGAIIGFNKFGGGHDGPVMAHNTDSNSVSHDQASLLGSGHSDSDHVSEEIDKSNVNLVESVEESIVEDEVEIVEEVTILEEEIIEDTPVEIKSNASASGNRFHAIAGVFNSMKNAKEFAAKHSSTTILEIGSYYKVSVGSYQTLNEAANSLPKLEAEYGSGVWITKQ